MRQSSSASLEYAGKKRQARREKFLSEMERVVPRGRLEALIEPHHLKSGKVGRPPVGVSRMLRMYFLQQWYSLSDERLEDAIYDSQAMGEFIGIDLSREQVSDATTLLKFRRKLEDKRLTAAMFEQVNAHLGERGLLMREGTLVDVTIIAAAPSTKNKDKARDPEMHQTKKGNQWHFGMKVHIGVDKRVEIVKAQAEGDIRKEVHWHVATKRGEIQAMAEGPFKELTILVERKKAQIRALVEHPFHVIKNLFRYRKVSYRGLKKNAARLYAQFAKVALLDNRNQGVGAS